MVTVGSAWLAGTGLAFARNPAFPAPTRPTYTTPTTGGTTIINIPNVTPPTVAGIEPQAYEAILYGKDIPLFVGGKILLGGRIVEGPFFAGTQTDPTVSFIAYHAQNIVPTFFATTVVTSARLRGQEVWNEDDGYIATDKVPNGSFAWRPGHNTNLPFPQSIGRYGASAVAYLYGITSSWENIPLKPFGGIVPFPSVMAEAQAYGDPTDGITRTQAIINVLTRMGLQGFEYEVNVSGSDPAWLVANNMSLPEFLGQLRAIFTQYHITYSDKLRIIEPDAFSVAGELTNSNVLRDTLRFRRTDPMSLPREKRYTYIDVDRDYEPNTALAKEDLLPIRTTDATGSVSIELPIATTAAQAVADIHNSLYEELKVRSQMEGVVDRTLFGLECGDGVRFADSPVINMTARVLETVDDFKEWNTQFKAGEVLNCGSEAESAGTIEFIGFHEAAGTNNTYSFLSCDIGVAAADRIVIVVATSSKLISPARAVTSVTIGGNAATIHATADEGDSGIGVNPSLSIAIASLAVPSGTTAGITITLANNVDGSCIAVYALYGLASATPHDTAFDTDPAGGNLSTTIDVPAGGIVIAGYAAVGGTLGSASWTGLSAVDQNETFPDTAWSSGATQSGLAAETGRTISVASSASGAEVLIAASFS